MRLKILFPFSISCKTILNKMRLKNFFLGICAWAIVALYVVHVWKTKPKATFRSAPSAKEPVGLLIQNSVPRSLARDGFGKETFDSVPHNLTRDDCEKEAACRIKKLTQRSRHVCRTDKKIKHHLDKRNFHGILNHDYKMLYFAINKVGCSFWKRIFKVLHSNMSETVFDIPNYKAHHGYGLKMAKTRSEVDMYLQTYTSFMFVRDPFSRFFSGYIDKLFIPNKLSLNFANQMNSDNSSGGDTPAHNCSINISFGDFATYTANKIASDTMTDAHFKPMWRWLNPCDYNVTYIAKMEHFMDDTDYILSSVGLGLENVTGTSSDANFDEKHEKGYMKDIINRTFHHLTRLKRCIPHEKILQRLWSSFQIRGYLSKTQPMPKFKNVDDVMIHEFVVASWAAHDLAGPKSERSSQRREALMEAYSTVPRKTLYKLAQGFDMDCRVFDYNCNVDEVFPVNNSIQPFYFKDW